MLHYLNSSLSSSKAIRQLITLWDVVAASIRPIVDTNILIATALRKLGRQAYLNELPEKTFWRVSTSNNMNDFHFSVPVSRDSTASVHIQYLDVLELQHLHPSLINVINWTCAFLLSPLKMSLFKSGCLQLYIHYLCFSAIIYIQFYRLKVKFIIQY